MNAAHQLIVLGGAFYSSLRLIPGCSSSLYGNSILKEEQSSAFLSGANSRISQNSLNPSQLWLPVKKIQRVGVQIA
jgi:hypothetical protein